MANIDYSFENSIPIGPLKIAALDSCKDFAKNENSKLFNTRIRDRICQMSKTLAAATKIGRASCRERV